MIKNVNLQVDTLKNSVYASVAQILGRVRDRSQWRYSNRQKIQDIKKTQIVGYQEVSGKTDAN